MLLTHNKTIRKIAGIVETFNILFLKLLIKKRSKARVFPGKMFRGYMSLIGEDKWKSRDIFDIIGQDGLKVTIEHLKGEGIDTSVDELVFLAMITKSRNPKNIFEIGTFRGRTALNFALNSPDDCMVNTLDLPQEEDQADHNYKKADKKIIAQSITGADYRGKKVESKIKQLYGNSLNFDFSEYYRKMDIVFIDGAHHYDAVISDTENALKMVKTKGIIIWHDFANYGDYNDVTRAVMNILPKDEVIQIQDSQLAIYIKK
jgi:predicted O-methyltransferase YrrM